MVSSCLTGAKRGMKRAVLEVIATKTVVYAADVKRYIKCTLLAATTDFEVHFLVCISCMLYRQLWLCSPIGQRDYIDTSFWKMC